MMPGMTESALDTTAPTATDPVAAPAAVDPATTPPSLAPTSADAPEQLGTPVVVAPDGSTQTLREFVGVDEPAEPELTGEEKATKEWLDAETAWKTAFDKDWKYERYEFHGDLLAVRIPKQGALLAVSMGGAKYGPEDRGLGAMNQFCNLHLGPESFARVTERMMNPDDTAYGDTPLGDLFQALGKLTPE